MEDDAIERGTEDNFKTPHVAPPYSRPPASFTPCTPYTALVFWGSPGENSPTPPKPDGRVGKCVTAPPDAKRRRPLVEKTTAPLTPGTHTQYTYNIKIKLEGIFGLAEFSLCYIQVQGFACQPFLMYKGVV